MQIENRQVGDVSIVKLHGRLVAGVGDIVLRDSMNELLADGSKKILLDLSAVTHIDSSGVGELVASSRIAQRFGSALKVVRAQEGVESVFHIAQILPLFSFYDDVDGALEAFSSDESVASDAAADA